MSNDDEIRQNIELEYRLKQIKVGQRVNGINIWMERVDGQEQAGVVVKQAAGAVKSAGTEE